MTGGSLAPVYPRPVAIPVLRRRDTVEVFRRAAERLQTQAINSNLAEARPELALAAAAGSYRKGQLRIPQPWILPLFRDVMDLGPRELAQWETDASLMGRSMVLRAIAHAIENGDIP
ncbi:MAG TPA: hypothetical protein VGS97_26045 [Actinocrinis sp.]|uniref:hypothetical protein n=1 Tax=Actinocrinis sp. TaxID=1920516 RepID=UPI002DDCB491|nr:hypothetical protein [Actinocrinis sp.]HEV2347580.1 hypothetical protein [Actinocrinis sp.]